MFKKWLGWLLLAVCTLLNVRLFLGRWAEDPRSDFGSLLSDPEVSSLVLGFAVAVVAMALLDTLRARRWAGLLALGAACAGLALAMPSLGVFKNFGSPLGNFVAVGAAAALACAGLRESASASFSYSE